MSRAYYMWHKFHNSSKRQHFSSEEEIICISVLDLACKMEETAIRLAEMARFVHLMFHPESKLGVKDVRTALESKVIICQQGIMESIKFETAASNPFSTLIKIAKFLKLNKSKTASAWDYLKRSYESPACIRFPSNVIALSAIELSESSETCRFLRPCPEDLSVLSQLKCDPLDLKHSCLVILINSYSFSRKKILDYLLDECGFRGISPSFTSHLILKGAADD